MDIMSINCRVEPCDHAHSRNTLYVISILIRYDSRPI